MNILVYPIHTCNYRKKSNCRTQITSITITQIYNLHLKLLTNNCENG